MPAAPGRSTRKSAPPPGPSVTRNDPPCSSTSSRAIARPSPVPPKRRVVRSSPRRKRSKIAPRISTGTPGPSSATVSVTRPPRAPTSTRTRPPSGANLKALESRPRSTRAIRSGSTKPAASPGATTASSTRRSRATAWKEDTVRRSNAARSTGSRCISTRAGLEVGDVEQVAHVPHQRPRVTFEVLEGPPLLRALGHRRQQPAHGTEDQRQRPAELVAHVGEQLALRPLEFLHPLVEPAQLLVLARQLLPGALLLGDVAALGQEEHHPPRVIPDRLQREVDGHQLGPAAAPKTSTS